MRPHLIALVFLGLSIALYGTEQMPDYLTVEGQRGELITDWSYLSPLERYFTQSKKKYPFEETHTANYRGHVAEWKVEGKKLFLKGIKVESRRKDVGTGELDAPFDLKKLFPHADKEEGVFASWFSGILLTYEGAHRVDLPNGYYTTKYKKIRILTFKSGVLSESATLTPDQYWAAVREIHSDPPKKKFSPSGKLLKSYYDNQVRSED